MNTAGGVGRVIVVGGGLAGSLLAARVHQLAPDAELSLLEAGPALGGEHTWSFHESDLKPGYYRGTVLRPDFVRPFASASWDGHDVRFAGGARRLAGRYHSLRSGDFAAKVAAQLGPKLRLNAPVAALDARRVVLANGEELAASCVVDARGPAGLAAEDCAFQTFYGLFVRAAAPHGLTRPMLMDATVAQRGGFRFVYALPFSATTLLVEDTRFGAAAAPDEAGARALLPGYLQGLGVAAYEETGHESGSLPIPLAFAARPRGVPGTVAVGARAGLYQPTTGYSLRAAALTADLFARRLLAHGLAGMADFCEDYAEARWRAGGFYRRLNNMLFLAAAPDERVAVMARFYGLGERLVERFYAQELTLLDKAKILTGKPPVPLARGVRAFFARAAFA